jgi:dethiobiotin synthetase
MASHLALLFHYNDLKGRKLPAQLQRRGQPHDPAADDNNAFDLHPDVLNFKVCRRKSRGPINNRRMRRHRAPMTKIILITGTDTGVGKTVLTALLLRHLRRLGRRALAMKPFCSGGRQDAQLLQSLQKKYLTIGETNPFHFRQPLAPWVAAKKERRSIQFSTVEKKIRAVAGQCEILLIEGSGGLLAPLGPGYSSADLAVTFGSPTVVVGRNQLGTINHTLLTVRYLQAIGAKDVVVTLMGHPRPDISARSNVPSLQELMPGVAIFWVPYLGAGAGEIGGIKKNEKILKKRLHGILEVLL